MRTLIASEFVTLDGVMESPGGEPGHLHTGWAIDYMDAEIAACKLEELREADALLLGRVTYESFAGAWPDRGGSEPQVDEAFRDIGGIVVAMANRLNSMPKHLVSSTLRKPTWNNTHLLAGDVTAAVTRLKANDGGPILLNGSRRLLHALIERDMVDEYRLMVFPVTVGSGDRIFPATTRKMALELVDLRGFASGVVLQTYRPAAAR